MKPANQDRFSKGIHSTRVSFFMGAGGVGKTSISAAKALSLAMSGKKVLIASLDPAKRLGTILEVSELAKPTQHPSHSHLYCVQQDAETVLANAVSHFSDSEKTTKIMEHPFYKVLSSGISGLTEYMALFSLHRWWESGEYDYIVVDTAPHVHAIEVLKRPGVVKAFQENGVVKRLVFPLAKLGSIGMGLFQGVAGQLPLKVLGVKLFQDLAAFMVLMEDTINGFYRISGDLENLLKSDSTECVFVGTPFHQTLAVFELLEKELATLGTSFQAAFLNKTIDGSEVHTQTEQSSFFYQKLQQQREIETSLKAKMDTLVRLPTVVSGKVSPRKVVEALAQSISEF